jgi:hypothetical protein
MSALCCDPRKEIYQTGMGKIILLLLLLLLL